MDFDKILIRLAALASIVAIVGFGWFYCQVYTWDARISTIEQIVQSKPSMEKDGLMGILESKSIKEDMYINQLDKTSD